MLNKEDLERIPEDAKYIFFNEDGSVRSALFGQRVSDRIEDIEKVNPILGLSMRMIMKGF